MDSDPAAEAIAALTPEMIGLQDQVRRLEARLLNKGDMQRRLDHERKLNADLERELATFHALDHRSAPPEWLIKPPKPGKHHATPWLVLSDLHLDEVVQPGELQGINAYNREIALGRLERTAGNFVQVATSYLSGVTYDGVVMPMIGDIFSGEIHEELKETNADTIYGSLDFWLDPLGAVVSLLADEFGKVHVPVVVGNHGRNTRKPRAKFKARSNLDWLVGKQLARMFRKDKRVTFDVSDSPDLLVQSYGSHVMLTHGDQAKGGSGIGGLMPVLMRLNARKQQRQSAVGQPYDTLIMGHWHQLVFGPAFIVNGSLKGYDEYAYENNFGFEVPQQAAFLMTPEHGRTFTFPVFSQDRKREGW